MDSLETVCSVDDFLNFNLDIDEQNPKEEAEKQHQEEEENYQKHSPNSSFESHQNQLNILDSISVLEEDLEWLNEKEFPPFEPFFLSFQSPKHQSPVSVLENGVGSGSIRIPGRARSQIQRKRRFAVPGLFSVWSGDGKKGVGVVEQRRKCLHCLSEKTPQWRAGPLGPKTLCNACGVRYKAGRLVPEYRPANSPSFSSDLHSNSYRKILEMRRKKQKVLEKG